MKFSFKALMAIVISSLTFASCLNEVMDTPVPEGVASYTAYVDGSATKAELDGNVSMWNGDESIQVASI